MTSHEDPPGNKPKQSYHQIEDIALSRFNGKAGVTAETRLIPLYTHSWRSTATRVEALPRFDKASGTQAA